MRLFHYTDVAAIQSILDTKKLWFTDFRFLNDSTELHDGFDVLAGIMNDTNHKLFKNLNNKEKVLKVINAMLFKDDTYHPNLEPVFIFSLSSKNDLLSQWRAYGSYAIEFDSQLLENRTGRTHHCVYTKSEKIERAINSIAQAINTIESEMSDNKGCLGPIGSDALIKLVLDMASFKHKGFAEESEYRIISQSGSTITEHNTKYRVKNDILIPYIEVEISMDCIKSILIGPVKNHKLAYISMQEFVKQEVAKWNEKSDNPEYELPVIESDIPYRGK